GGKPRSQHLTAVGASLLAGSVGSQRRSPNQPVPTDGSALLRPDDADRKQLRACHSRARSPLVEDPERFQYPASRDQSRAWRLVLPVRRWFHQITAPNILNWDTGLGIRILPSPRALPATQALLPEQVSKPGEDEAAN